MEKTQQNHPYHLIDPSPWPLLGAFSALFMFVGGVFFIHGKQLGYVMLPVGILAVIAVMYVWWRDVIREAIIDKCHNHVVQHGLRIGMVLFILSEVMFFFAFFWAFFKAAIFPVLLYEGAHLFDSAAPPIIGQWPPKGVETFNPWDLPFINTLILLLSGTTVTWAHYGILHNDRKTVIRGLMITVVLGLLFTTLQAFEYMHAAFGFKDGIYSSTFYMATGFHGAHVIIGTIFLLVCLLRVMKGQMNAKHHVGFECAAWYWHFVDVVWLFLFIFVYIWGA